MTAEPGWQTTEFWVTLVTQILAVLATFHVIKLTNDQTQTIIGMSTFIITTVGYQLSRAFRKKGTTG